MRLAQQSHHASRSFLRSFCVSVLCLVSACMAFGIYLDQYWLFRNQPPWVDSNRLGSNEILDRNMRQARILQLFCRRADVGIIGSSVVYRGISPPPGSSILNAGVSSLMSDELPNLVSSAAKNGHLKKLVIGLDYFMFTDIAVAKRIGPADVERGRIYHLLVSSLINSNIVDRIQDGIPPSREAGGWHASGFRTTADRDPATTRAIDQSQRSHAKPYQHQLSQHLRDAVRNSGSLNLIIYLSPVSLAQRRLWQELGLADDVDRWRTEMRKIAAESNTAFHDLMELDANDAFSPETGSSATWFDNLHFKPEIGDRVLEVLRLRS
jgi:hypothetical protein